MKRTLTIIAISIALTACGNEGETTKQPASSANEVVVTSPGVATGDSLRNMGPTKAVVNKAIEDAITEFAMHAGFSKFDGFKIKDEKAKGNTVEFVVTYNRTFEKDLFEFEMELMKSKKSVLPIIELAKRFGDTMEVGKPIAQEAVITLENKDKKWALVKAPFTDLSVPKATKDKKASDVIEDKKVDGKTKVKKSL
jgi:hypothetical protein